MYPKSAVDDKVRRRLFHCLHRHFCPNSMRGSVLLVAYTEIRRGVTELQSVQGVGFLGSDVYDANTRLVVSFLATMVLTDLAIRDGTLSCELDEN